MSNDTWTHAMARACVRPLLGTPVKPNHLTTLRLLTGVAGCLCLALPPTLGHRSALLGAGGVLWLLSCFLDRADGELARIGDMMSAAGHRYDYVVDVGVNCLFFLAIGFGLTDANLAGQRLGDWSVLLGIVASSAMFACCWLSERFETLSPSDTRAFEGGFGFHLDDALYLLGPAAWFGLLLPILLGGAAGTMAMAIVVSIKLARLRPAAASTPERVV